MAPRQRPEHRRNQARVRKWYELRPTCGADATSARVQMQTNYSLAPRPDEATANRTSPSVPRKCATCSCSLHGRNFEDEDVGSIRAEVAREGDEVAVTADVGERDVPVVLARVAAVMGESSHLAGAVGGDLDDLVLIRVRHRF